VVWGGVGGETLVDPLPMSFTWLGGVPTTCYQVGFAVVLRKKEKKTLNLSLPILVMEGRNLKKVHTTQNISAKNYVD
jgi:hypothetical protein